MFDVLVVGELNIDLIFNEIDKFPEVGKEVLAGQMTLTLGSSSAIFAGNLKAMGSEVAFAGMIGQDIFGDFILKSLKDKNVNTGYLVKSASLKTGATAVITQGEDRANLTYQGAMKALSANDISPEMLQSARHLHISSIFLQPELKKGLAGLLERAKKAGLTTSLDPQWDPDEKWDLGIESLLPLVDIFLPNMQEFLNLSHCRDLQAGIEKLAPYSRHLVIKDGSNGAYLWSEGKLLSQPAFLNDRVVDCTGAGDSFDAGFIHRFVRGETMEECLRFAALMGAINTTAAGGTGAFGDMEIIRRTALNRFNYPI
jgi:sugar/nucleoside kinase (ribokinase family)